MAASDNVISLIITAKDEATGALSNMSADFSKALNTASVAIAGVGVGLTAYAKNATDFTVSLVSQSKAIARQTGETVESSSQLLYVFQHMGLSASDAGTEFNFFSKQIEATRNATADSALKTADLKNKIDAAKLAIGTYTAEIVKNGDATGLLHNKIDALKINIQGYQQELKDATTPLERLNVATQNADGSNRGFSQILLDVADRFQAMPDGVDKTTDALQLFGRSGTDMIKVLNKGRDGILDLEKEADKLGLTLNAQTIGSVTKYIQAQKALEDQSNSLKMTVGSLTTPVLTAYETRLTSITQKLVGMDSPFRSVIADVLAFGGPVAAGASSVLAFTANLDQAIPILNALRGLLVNPMFILFSIAVLGMTEGVMHLHTQLGSWSAVMQSLTTQLTLIYQQVSAALMPSLMALWNVVETQLAPTMERLWKEVIEPLIPVIGTLLVAALWATINALNLLLQVLIPVINFMLDNKPVVVGLATAFGILAIAMNFDAITGAFVANMAVVQTSIAATQAGVTGLVAFLGGAAAAAGWAAFAAVAVAALVLVYNKGQETLALLDKINSQKETELAGDTAAEKSVIDAYHAGRITKAQYDHYFNTVAPGIGHPAHALGTNFASGGMAMVGEDGPEGVVLPRGAQVVPHYQLAQNGSRMGGATIENLHVTVNNDVDALMVVRQIGWALATR